MPRARPLSSPFRRARAALPFAALLAAALPAHADLSSDTERLARAELRAKSEGAARVTRASMRSSITGAGEFDLELPAGCHRLELMAEIPTVVPRRATDIDAQARSQEGRLLARDRADVPDARLDFCLGEPTLVEVPFTGASGAVSVTLANAMWPKAAAGGVQPARGGADPHRVDAEELVAGALPTQAKQRRLS